jgi:hypothetical protein
VIHWVSEKDGSNWHLAADKPSGIWFILPIAHVVDEHDTFRKAGDSTRTCQLAWICSILSKVRSATNQNERADNPGSGPSN